MRFWNATRIRLGHSTSICRLQRLELALDNVHGQDQGVAEILALVRAHELVILRFVAENKGAALEDRRC